MKWCTRKNERTNEIEKTLYLMRGDIIMLEESDVNEEQKRRLNDLTAQLNKLTELLERD